MLKSRQAKAMALAGLMGVAGLMTGCSGPTDPTPQPKTCDCPETEHLGVGETCCGADDCACTMQSEVLTVNGQDILVLREIGVEPNDLITIAGYFDPIISIKGMVEKDFFRKNITEIRIRSRGSGINYDYDGKILFVGGDESAYNVEKFLAINRFFAEEKEITTLSIPRSIKLGDALVPGTKFDIA